MNLFHTWDTSDEHAFLRLQGEHRLIPVEDRRRFMHDINTIRRTVRCLAGCILSGLLDDGTGGPVLNTAGRRCFLRFVQWPSITVVSDPSTSDMDFNHRVDDSAATG